MTIAYLACFVGANLHRGQSAKEAFLVWWPNRPCLHAICYKPIGVNAGALGTHIPETFLSQFSPAGQNNRTHVLRELLQSRQYVEIRYDRHSYILRSVIISDYRYLSARWQ